MNNQLRVAARVFRERCQREYRFLGQILKFGYAMKVGEFNVPTRLCALTGCPPEQFESYGKSQFQILQEYLHIGECDSVLEIGCGAGRLAIPCTKVLRDGSYLGIDIIRSSIRWCTVNISKRHPQFRFYWENVGSKLYNPAGIVDPASTRIPLPDASVDKIFLSSVFTHLFDDAVDHYLKEFHRVLKPGGKVLATLFLLNDERRDAIRQGKLNWTFRHTRSPICFFDDIEHTEGAVAYDEAGYIAMIQRNGMDLLQPVVYGSWSGAKGAKDGQDYVIFGLVAD